jgi:hypothetical protein
MSERTGWVSQYENDPGDDSGGSPRPPIWVVIVVVVSVVAGGWILFTQGSTDTDPVTSPTLLPPTPDEASVVTPTVAPDEASVVTTTVASPTAADPVSVFGNPPASVTAETPQQLAGYVAVSAGKRDAANTVWVLRAGGSVVSRNDVPTFDARVGGYPLLKFLMKGGHIAFVRSGNGYLLDADLIDGHEYVGPATYIIPGAEPRTLWFVDSPGLTTDTESVTLVKVESRTLGEPIEVTGVFSRPLVGVADGLIVYDLEEELAFWSPTDGLVPLDQLGDDAVFAASGNTVGVIQSGRVSLLDIVSGEYVSLDIVSGEYVSFLTFNVGLGRACLSPNGQHVIVLLPHGEVVLGNFTTGEVVGLMGVGEPFGPGVTVQLENGIGWTTDDQFVFIAEPAGDAKHIFGFDIATGERFVVAQLDGPGQWQLTASGTTC